MQAFPHLYSVAAAASAAGNVSVSAAGLEQLAVAPPAQFDGPGDRWSPESLLAAAVASCFILTFRAIARASQLQWSQLDCNVEATLERREGVTQFTRVVTHATLTVSADASTVLCERALNKAEEGCLVANSLRAERHLQMEIVKAFEDERDTGRAMG
ncbi:OsmC family protein [Peristeroidobacter soli]|jgi:peroxiredoxin-like protein|uniref:OsmC family protein n=1 Tax=Peristeroidobacter soli TaxID=2497877 RepID=UPI00101DE74B|nr:OsmC family protein [Peristeroidobacter soli]